MGSVWILSHHRYILDKLVDIEHNVSLKKKRKHCLIEHGSETSKLFPLVNKVLVSFQDAMHIFLLRQHLTELLPQYLRDMKFVSLARFLLEKFLLIIMILHHIEPRIYHILE
jgi:hypothetical protein